MIMAPVYRVGECEPDAVVKRTGAPLFLAKLFQFSGRIDHWHWALSLIGLEQLGGLGRYQFSEMLLVDFHHRPQGAAPHAVDRQQGEAHVLGGLAGLQTEFLGHPAQEQRGEQARAS